MSSRDDTTSKLPTDRISCPAKTRSSVVAKASLHLPRISINSSYRYGMGGGSRVGSQQLYSWPAGLARHSCSGNSDENSVLRETCTLPEIKVLMRIKFAYGRWAPGNPIRCLTSPSWQQRQPASQPRRRAPSAPTQRPPCACYAISSSFSPASTLSRTAPIPVSSATLTNDELTRRSRGTGRHPACKSPWPQDDQPGPRAL
jgi:hypothetical protein